MRFASRIFNRKYFLRIPAYHAAADLFTGIAGGLGQKIIRHPVDDDGASEDFRDAKALVIKRSPRIALVAE